MCESVCVSPCPGKCLIVASIPYSCSPLTYSRTRRDTARGSSPNERVLMIGLAGLLLTSASGAKLMRSEEHTSELQSPCNLVCRLLLEKKKKKNHNSVTVLME